MRDGTHGELNDDMSLLAGGKRTLVRLTQAVPPDAALATTSDGSLFITLACLAADAQLSAFSVWSPTFALGMLERLGQWRYEIADVLAGGNWGDHAEGARHLRCPRSPRAAALLRRWDGIATPAFFAASCSAASSITIGSGPTWSRRISPSPFFSPAVSTIFRPRRLHFTIVPSSSVVFIGLMYAST